MPRRSLLAAALLFAVTGPLDGQATTGAIRGEVADVAGDPLEGVAIVARGDRGVERTTRTDPTGTFHLVAIPPGLYAVEARFPEWPTSVARDVRVSIGGTTSVRFTLEAGFEGELTVHAQAPILDSTSAGVGVTYDARLLDRLPTRRRFWDLISISPGLSTLDDKVSQPVAYGSGISSSSWRVDGLDLTAPETGGTFLYVNPDTIEELRVLGIGAPAEVGGMLGAAIDVVTKSGGNDWRGGADAFLQFDALTDTNVELAGEEHPSFVLDRFQDFTATLGGPIRHDRAWFFAAGELLRQGEAEPGADPAYPTDREIDRYDLRVDAAPTERLRMTAKLHWDDLDLVRPGDASTTPSARAATTEEILAWGASFSGVLSSRTLLEARSAGWRNDSSTGSLTGSTEPAFFDYSPPAGGPSRFGSLAFPFDYETGVEQVDVKLSTLASDFLAGDHEFRFGVSYTQGSAETLTRDSVGGGLYYHYTYVEQGTPHDYYYLYTFRPFFYGAEQNAVAAFADDSWHVGDRLTIDLGVRYDRHRGWIPAYERLDAGGRGTGERLAGIDDVIAWDPVSPRIGFAWSATADMRTVVRGSYGIYHDGNVSGNWNYPPPAIPPIRLFQCDGWAIGCDDLLLEIAFPAAFNVDPELRPPRAVQYALSLERQIGAATKLGAQAVYKTTRDLIGWELLGDGVYRETRYVDPITGREQTLLALCPAAEGCRPATIRKGNRPGAGSPYPDERFHQTYRALILTVEKRPDDGWGLQGSYTWSRSEGLIPWPQIQVQGPPLYAGLPGTDPNEWWNADQLLQGDREHMLRLLGYRELPWGLEAKLVLNWESGRPYARVDRVRLPQGPIFYIAEPASDDRRLPSTLVVDLGVGKRLALGHGVLLELEVDLLNALNEDANYRWRTLWIRPGDEYVEADWPWPRRAMVHVGLEF